MLADDGQNINARVILMTKHLNDFAFCRCIALWVCHNAHDYLLPGDRSFKLILRDKNITVNPFVVRQNEGIRLMIIECSDDLGDSTLNNADNLALQTVLPLHSSISL